MFNYVTPSHSDTVVVNPATINMYSQIIAFLIIEFADLHRFIMVCLVRPFDDYTG